MTVKVTGVPAATSSSASSSSLSEGSIITIPIPAGEKGDLAGLKIRQKDYSADESSSSSAALLGTRGGVDDLIRLTHLHEPAILDVLVRCLSVSLRARAD